MIRLLLLLLALAFPAAAGEQVVAGLSQNQISITANFNGSEILVFGAVKREAPIPTDGPLEVIVTLEGPPTGLNIRKKDRRFGIWVNTESVAVNHAPSFYAIATTGPLDKILSSTDDLRYHITIPREIDNVGLASMAADAPSFTEALIRIREKEGLYALAEGSVDFQQSTLFRTSIRLPANLVEGTYKARIFLTRNAAVIAEHESDIEVQKTGLERWLFNLAKEQSLIYGLLSLVIAIGAGWLANAAFRLMRP